MKKKIVVFSDGTGNSSGKAQKTNVWRLFEAIEQDRPDVLAMYDDGVGTSANKYLAMLGGAFGWGLKRIVLDLYKFICRNYQQGDEIHGFGFSRGAFTIRVLVGLIDREGLVTFCSEDELDRNAKMAYRSYRKKSFRSWSPFVLLMRFLRDACLAVADRLRGRRTYAELSADVAARGRNDVRIRFLGLWDTVVAYGMPIEELKRGIHWLIWPMMFGDQKLSSKVDRAVHALALDDERTTFHPLPWDEKGEAAKVAAKEVPAGRITQVWFAGVHSNVGGGYPEDQLSLVTLAWMMNQAIDNGLPVGDSALERVNVEKSPYARLYDSRAGVASYYRYGPRRILTPAYAGNEILPIVHWSVIMRMVHGSDNYAPIILPHEFWVLAPDGVLIPKQGFARPLTLDSTKRELAAAASKIKPADKVALERKSLEAALATLERPDADAVELVRDTVWWRRVAYFATVLTSLLAVSYPLTRGWLAPAVRKMLESIPLFGESLVDASGLLQGMVTPVLGALAGFIPSYLSPWSEALVREPLEFGSIILAILISLAMGRILAARIEDRARLAWHKERRPQYFEWLRGRATGQRNVALVALFGLAGVAVFFHVRGRPEDGSTVWTLYLLAAIAAALSLWYIAQLREYRQIRADDPVRGAFALTLARWLRLNRPLNGIGRGLFKYVVPVLFAFALLIVGAFFLNRIAFDAVSAAGRFCTETPEQRLRDPTATATGFTTGQLCWASGIRLEKGWRYRITLETPGDWFDRTIRTDVNGFPSDGPRHFGATLLRRWWRENWFKPIARIGSRGNDEYVLEPGEPFAAHTYCTEPELYGGLNEAPIDTRDLVERAKRMVDACKPCVRKQAQVKDPNDIGSPITAESAEALQSCSPTPKGRDKLTAEIVPRTSGELFLYVNDAIWMVPGQIDTFYRNNSGSATLVRVERVRMRD